MLTTLLLTMLAQAPTDRVFFAPLRPNDDVDPMALLSLEDAVLVAARKAGVSIIGRGDVQAVLDVEAAKQAAGCTSDSCAAELADALGAPELLTGQVARLGTTWVLTLTHLERSSLAVLGRAQLQRDGDSVGVLLGGIETLVGETFHKAPPSVLVPVGVVTAGVGAVTAVLGGCLWALAAFQHGKGIEALEAGDVAGAAEVRKVWEQPYNIGIAATVVGVVVAATGGGLFLGGKLSSE